MTCTKYLAKLLSNHESLRSKIKNRKNSNFRKLFLTVSLKWAEEGTAALSSGILHFLSKKTDQKKSH